MSTTFTWTGTSASNWNTNNWGRGGVAPVFPGDTGSTTSDTIICQTSPPGTGPASGLTVANIVLRNFNGNFPATNAANLACSTSLTIGNGNGMGGITYVGSVMGCTISGETINPAYINAAGSSFGSLSPLNVLTYAAGGQFVAPTAAQMVQGQSCGDSGSIAGTQYVPAAANVLSGVNTGTTTGTFVAPTAAQMVHGQSCGVSGSIAGTQYVPTAANVLSGVSTGTTTGTFVAPTAAQMVQGQSCGVSGSIAGTQYVPTAANVLSGVSTGTTTGTFVAPTAAQMVQGQSCGVSGSIAGTQYVPTAANVLSGVSTGTTTGTFVAPTAAQMVQGQSCGVSGSIAGTQYVPAAANVLMGVSTGTTTGTFVAPTAAQMVYGQSCGVSGSIAGTQQIPAAQYVYAGVNTGTTAGILHAGNLHSGAGAPGADLTAAMLMAGNTVDDVTGTAADLGSLAAGQTSILNAVNAITRNTARSMPVTGTWFVRPAAGTAVYNVDLYLYNLAGQLEDPDNDAVAINAGSTAGAGDYNENLSATSMTQVSTGHYSVSYSVPGLDQDIPHAQGAVYFSFSWTITEAVGGASTPVSGADAAVVQVQDAEQLATLNDIDTQVSAISSLVHRGGPGNLAAMLAAVQALPSAAAIAAAVFLVDLAGVQDAAPENSLCTVCLAGLHSSVAGTTWTIRKTDGTTKVAKTVAIAADAAPIVGVT